MDVQFGDTRPTSRHQRHKHVYSALHGSALHGLIAKHAIDYENHGDPMVGQEAINALTTLTHGIGDNSNARSYSYAVRVRECASRGMSPP